VADRDLGKLIMQSNPVEWRELLALACSYANETEFRDLCSAFSPLFPVLALTGVLTHFVTDLLGQRLEGVLGDMRGALVCYMCAGNTDKVIIELVRRTARVDGDLYVILSAARYFRNVVFVINAYCVCMSTGRTHCVTSWSSSACTAAPCRTTQPTN
jgi:hypothetical protein